MRLDRAAVFLLAGVRRRFTSLPAALSGVQSRTFSTGMQEDFFKLPSFVVVGASAERSKFGNKILRAYKEKGYSVTPISKKATEIEGIACEASLTSYSQRFPGQVATTGVSIVTPPAATKQVLEEGLALGYKHFFFQPGTVDETVAPLLGKAETEHRANIIKDCVLVQLGLDPHHF